MTSRLLLAILVTCLVAGQDLAVAQVAAGDVTLKVPVNLTKLSTDLVKVRAACGLRSTAIRFVNPTTGQETQTVVASVEAPVSNGQVITTLTVVFSKFSLVNPAGVTATYQCDLLGTDRTGLSGTLTEGQPVGAFRLTPSLGTQSGTFTW